MHSRGGPDACRPMPRELFCTLRKSQYRHAAVVYLHAVIANLHHSSRLLGNNYTEISNVIYIDEGVYCRKKCITVWNANEQNRREKKVKWIRYGGVKQGGTHVYDYKVKPLSDLSPPLQLFRKFQIHQWNLSKNSKFAYKFGCLFGSMFPDENHRFVIGMSLSKLCSFSRSIVWLKNC